MKKLAKRLLVAALTLSLALLAVELGTRWLLFGGHPAFERHRDANQFADYYSEDDYWKLDHALGSSYDWPKHPHPLLGWGGRFDGETYRHWDSSAVGDRRPVLLYGDSFSICTGGVACFEDILGADPEFSADHYLLNYGVGGYGLDQTWQLLELSIDRYTGEGKRAPFVVVGLLPYDLDRSILSVRTGQKPRFALRDGELVQVGEPISSDPETWWAEHPPEIRSYAWRRFLHSWLCPEGISRWLRGEAAAEQEKRRLNAAILTAIQRALEDRGLDYAFLVFYPNREPGPDGDVTDVPPDWRDRFLREWLDASGADYVWVRDVLRERAPGASREELYQPDNHPTAFQNGLIAAELRELVLR